MKDWLKIFPGKGLLLREYPKKDILEIYEIREVLEGLEFRLACSKITDSQIVMLKEKAG
ncbi:hypothetical protein GCM10020331_006330 [Ectobacillus funiculus]